MGQKLVALVIIQLGMYLECVSVSVAHLYVDMFGHSSRQNFSNSVRLDGRCNIQVLLQIHNCTEVWPSTGRFEFLDLNDSRVAPVICLEPSSCWKSSLRPVWSFWQTETHFRFINLGLNHRSHTVCFYDAFVNVLDRESGFWLLGV